MAIRVGDNILPNIKGNLDARYGPYNSILEALEKVFDPDSENRDKGITVGIKFGDTIKEYWFLGGTDDSNFVEKIQEINQDDFVKKTERGVANGVAPLDDQGLIPNNHLPSYVDDVIEVYASFDKSSSGALENIQLYLNEQKTESVVGERGKIYIDLLTNYQFRWSGTIFTPISIPDSSIVDLGQFESETAADNVMLADNTGVIFNSQCLIITYKIGEQRAIIINQYSTSQTLQYKYFNGELFYRIILHDGTTVLTNHGWVSTGALKLMYINEQRLLQLINRTNVKLGEVELPLVTSTTDGLMSKEDKGSLDDNTTKISSIYEGDLPFNNTLSLNGTWTIYDLNGSVVEQRPLPLQDDKKDVEDGYKAQYSGAWMWTLVKGNKPATETNGAWETELPSSGDWSKTRTFDRVTTTKTYTLYIYAYKRGLVVSGSNVVPAEKIGSKDSGSISTSITFKHRLYYGAVMSNTPSGEDIKTLTSKLVSTRANSITNITVPKEKYYCIAYPTNLGELKYITQNGSSPILSAFNLLKNIEITNGAGKKILLYVYVSVRKGPFTNDNLTLE